MIETVEPRGLLVSDGLRKILEGDRNVESVTAGADLCDSACLKKVHDLLRCFIFGAFRSVFYFWNLSLSQVLEYISAISEGRLSTDDWPTMATLTGPNGNTKRFIDANQQAFVMIATAGSDASGGGSGDDAKRQLREVLDKCEARFLSRFDTKTYHFTKTSSAQPSEKSRQRVDFCRWEAGNWEVRDGVELMWRGERREHVVRAIDDDQKTPPLFLRAGF